MTDRPQWTLRAGIYYCYLNGNKLFELKQGVGKWTITALGRAYEHKVALDPDLAKAFALDWYIESSLDVVRCLQNAT